jgi:HK97 family phage prohead protease
MGITYLDPLTIWQPTTASGRAAKAWAEEQAREQQRGFDAYCALEEKKRKAKRMRRLELRARAACILAVANSDRPSSIGTLSGLAIPFERFGRPSPTETEIIGPHACDELLDSSAEVALLVDHDRLMPLAKRSNFGVRLTKSPKGLRVEADLPPSDEGRLVARLLESGKVAGFSFSIRFPDSEYRVDDIEGLKVRYFSRLTISEISLITAPRTPAYPLVGTIDWKRRKA